MKENFVIDNRELTQRDVREIIEHKLKLVIHEKQRGYLVSQRELLQNLLKNTAVPVYGINTGFGALCNTIIPENQLNELQLNLVRSHACGFGGNASREICQLTLLLKILSLSKGYSAVSMELLDFLINLYNESIFPVIPHMGSLGASGDLAPLAHLSLCCIGEGFVYFENSTHAAEDIFKQKNIAVPFLKSKEGLALLNGTQYSLALLMKAFWSAKTCYQNANMIAALSMEAFNCNISFLHPEIHQIRNQTGQIHAAGQLRHWLHDSDINLRENKSVQDPYSFRCAPQVHGASYDVILYCEKIINAEINSVTDNPLLVSGNEIISGGNFHAQPLALSADFLCIAMSELANISERRIYQLVCGNRDLPDFLTSEAGLNSGYMIVQYAAASAVSLNKQYCTPSSVDSIISSKGQEDHVSMAANAGIRCNKVVEQTEMVLAMEWMTACRAWHFRKNWKANPGLTKHWKTYLDKVPFKNADHIPAYDYPFAISFLRNLGSLD